MSDPEYLHERNQDLRDKVLAGLGDVFRDQIAMVRFPIHVEDETTAVGPVPILGGTVILSHSVQAAHIFMTHHGTGDANNNGVRYRLHTSFESENIANDPLFGNGTFEVTNGSGHFTNANGCMRPLLEYHYRRLGLMLQKAVFTEADTWRAIYNLRLNNKLVFSQQVATDENPYIPRTWKWLNRHFLGPIGEIPPQTWMWY